jgi:hypothetical protein
MRDRLKATANPETEFRRSWASFGNIASRGPARNAQDRWYKALEEKIDPERLKRRGRKVCNQLCNPLKSLIINKRWPIIKELGIKAQ